ncbi:globin domain-containing protein [Haloechinothrix sp. LS1_15]|uniref:globin domain-containing protein n=1 Tax=Haloechinothrix sp. LS1_15 TaxID=2652248 RepID=UPI002947E44A|nr:globin domain-containing protein [Haloechinothrix sp. LS1_15]MDV6011130.1 flavohemoprotein [Haloechinothrix sp. LS1_15]
MTANAALDDPGEHENPYAAQQRRAARVVHLIRDSFATVEPRADEVARYFYAVLFTIAPNTRDLFPINMEVQRSRFFHAMVHVVQMIDRPQELEPYLRQLGRDHRKFDVVNEHFEAVGTALLAALKHYLDEDWTEELERAWADAYAVVARTMQEGAADATGPAWWPATVVDHHRIDRSVAVIRVQPDEPVPYRSGQYVSVEIPQRPRLWRSLSPANPPRDDGIMEFHVRTVDSGWVSRPLVHHVQIGDRWRIGSPMGNLWMNPAADRDMLLIAGGTGLAPMRAVIGELEQRTNTPNVELFFGGRTASDLYQLDELRQLAGRYPWLSLTPVTEDGSVPGGFAGTLPEIVTSYGPWTGYDVLIAGSPEMIRATVSRMLVAGTTFDQISYDSFPTD